MSQQWDDATVIERLQAAACDGVGVSRKEWVRRGLAPSSETVFQRFGSCNAALEAAGLTNPTPVMVKAAPVVAVIRQMYGDASYSEIARDLGCDHRTISRLFRGLVRSMSDRNADRILCELGRPDVYRQLEPV